MGIKSIFSCLRGYVMLIGWLIVWSSPLFAQNAADKQKLYLQGKQELELKNWEEAIQFFNLAEMGPQQPYLPYLYYYKVVAFIQTENWPEAEEYLNKLESEFKSHPIQKEVLLQRLSLIRSTQNTTAFIDLDQTTASSDSLTNIFESLRNYFFEAASSDSLEVWHKKYSDYRPIALALASRYMLSDKDSIQQRLNLLLKKFDINKSSLPKSILTLRAAKQFNDVALILPISEPLLDTARKSVSTPFLFEYYIGFIKGFQLENSVNKNVRLHIFTPGRSIDSLQLLIQKPELQFMDMIVGPVLTQQSMMIAEFAEKYRIIMWNPINDNKEIIQDKNYIFSPKPQSITIARLVSKYVKKQSLADTAIIFTGSSEKEQEQGRLYADQLQQDSMIVLKNWRWGQSTAAEWYDSLQIIGMDSLKHIFAPITAPTSAAALMSLLERIPNMLEMYTGPEWLENNLISFDQFERRHFTFYYPDLIKYDHPSTMNFRTYYLKTIGVVPSVYAYQGYDHGILLFRLISKNKVGLRSYIKKNFLKGEIFHGYDFRNSNDNAYVPLIKFNKKNLELINPPD